MNAPFHHHAEIVALREENDILRETVRQLREDLAPRRGFPIAWRLRPQQATVLSCIMAASPRIATHNRIRASLYGGGEIPDSADDLIDVLLSGIRKRMRAAGVEHGFSNVFGVGYVMPAADRDRILAALSSSEERSSVGNG
jgi:DNA-binding response OmpR family regulator